MFNILVTFYIIVTPNVVNTSSSDDPPTLRIRFTGQMEQQETPCVLVVYEADGEDETFETARFGEDDILARIPGTLHQNTSNPIGPHEFRPNIDLMAIRGYFQSTLIFPFSPTVLFNFSDNPHDTIRIPFMGKEVEDDYRYELTFVLEQGENDIGATNAHTTILHRPPSQEAHVRFSPIVIQLEEGRGNDGTINPVGEWLTYVPLEDYVFGVVCSEIGDFVSNDNFEAVKAQAIAARSFVIARMKRRGEPVLSGVDWQAYKRDRIRRVVVEEDEPKLDLIKRAVIETVGQVVTTRQEIIIGGVRFSPNEIFMTRYIGSENPLPTDNAINHRHNNQLEQNEALALARADSRWTCYRILTHFYPGAVGNPEPGRNLDMGVNQNDVVTPNYNLKWDTYSVCGNDCQNNNPDGFSCENLEQFRRHDLNSADDRVKNRAINYVKTIQKHLAIFGCKTDLSWKRYGADGDWGSGFERAFSRFLNMQRLIGVTEDDVTILEPISINLTANPEITVEAINKLKYYCRGIRSLRAYAGRALEG